MTATKIADIPREKLTPGKFQNRDIFEDAKIAELAASIASEGIIHPIVVKPAGKGTFEIVDGERRWRAAERAGLATVPCIVRDLGEAEHALATVIANLQRVDLTCIEEARGFGNLRDAAGLAPEAIAARVGRAPEYVKDALRLLALPEAVQQLAHVGAWVGKEGEDRALLKLSRSQALALATHLPKFGPELVAEMARVALAGGIPAARIARNPISLIDDYARGQRDEQGYPKEGALAYSLPYNGGPFYEAHCARCPFGKLLGEKGQYGGGTMICLQPAHYRELQARKDEEDRKAREKRVAAAREKLAKEGKPVDLPMLDSFPYGSYVNFKYEGRDKAVACTDDCPCRTVALDASGKAVVICADIKRFTQLKRKESAAYNKDRRADADAKKKLVAAELDRVAATPQGYTEREIRLLAETALNTINSNTKKIVEAGRHILPHLGRDQLFDPGQDSASTYFGNKLGSLAAVPTPALVRFAAEALALHDLVGYAESGATLMRSAGRYLPREAPAEDGAGDDAAEADFPTADPATISVAEQEEWNAAEAALATSADEEPTAAGQPIDVEAARAELLRRIEEAPPGLKGALVAIMEREAAKNAPALATAEVAGAVVTGPAEAVERTWERLGDTPDPEYRSARSIDEAAPARETPPATEGDEDFGVAEDVRLAALRHDWAYEVLAQYDRDPASVVVLHRAKSGDLLAFGEDGNYLYATHRIPLEDAPGGELAARVPKRDAERLVGVVSNADGFTVVIVPAEGSELVTVEPADPDADDEGAGGSLDDQLAAIDAL